MSTDKYWAYFMPVEATVVIILKTFFATCMILRIGVHLDIPLFWGIFSYVTCLDQSRTNISIWYISLSKEWTVLWEKVEETEFWGQKNWYPSILVKLEV